MILLSFICLSYFYATSFAQSNEIVPLLVQDFESPNVDIWGTGKCRRPGRSGTTNYFCNLCSSSYASGDINNWYATSEFSYSQCKSVEIIKAGDWTSTNPNLGSAYLRPDGNTWNQTWADPMGKGGQYVLGMGGRNDKGYVGGSDHLFMSFDTKGKTLINVAFDLSPTKYMACGSMSVTDFAAQMRVSVHNEDSFPAQYCSTYSTPFAPPQYVYAPRHPECPYTFSNTYNETTTHAKCFELYWTRVQVSFNLTNAVDDIITLIITGGEDYYAYVAIDNIVIVSADEVIFTTTRAPTTAPTKAPSAPPTSAPTSVPTAQPSPSPTTAAPTTGAPTTGAPTTGAPTTGAPTDAAPTSAPPTNAAGDEQQGPPVNSNPLVGLFGQTAWWWPLAAAGLLLCICCFIVILCVTQRRKRRRRPVVVPPATELGGGSGGGGSRSRSASKSTRSRSGSRSRRSRSASRSTGGGGQSTAQLHQALGV